MPGAPCKVLNTYHIVVGADLHDQMPPPVPAPAPHVVVYVLGFATPWTSQEAQTVKAGYGHAVAREHDLGPGPYHIPLAVNALLPLIWLGAGNKAEFGVASVKVKGRNGSNRLAVALIPFIGMNLQLDCGLPCPLPSSRALACFNTVVAGFTFADCVAGFAAMIADIGITFLTGFVAGKIVKGIGLGIISVVAAAGDGVTAWLVVGLRSAAFPTVAAYVSKGAELALGWLIGSPLGYSFPIAPGSTKGQALNESINDWISPTPSPPALPAGGHGSSSGAGGAHE